MKKVVSVQKVLTFLAATGLAFSFICGTVGCTTADVGSKPSCKTVKELDNSAFYKGGKFDREVARNAYFDMCKRFNFPIFPSFLEDKGYFWVADWGQGDFASCGMGGVIYLNEKKEGYFSHDIFLLPNQHIAEHRHMPTKDKDGKTIRCKMESWVVRHGYIYGFSEIGEPNLDKYPEAKAMISKKQIPYLKCVHVDKWTADGRAHKLAKDESWHFMLAGPEGAIVTESATFHDNAGLRFSIPSIKSF